MSEIIRFEKYKPKQDEKQKIREWFSTEEITTKHLVIRTDEEELLKNPFYKDLILESEIEDMSYKQYSLKVTEEVREYYEFDKYFTADTISADSEKALKKYGCYLIDDMGISSETVMKLKKMNIRTVNDLCNSDLRSIFKTLFEERGGRKRVRELCDQMLQRNLRFYVSYSIMIETMPASFHNEHDISYNELTSANVLYLIYPEVFRPYKKIDQMEYRQYRNVINEDNKIHMPDELMNDLAYLPIVDMGLTESVRMLLYSESIFFMKDLLFRAFADVINIQGMTIGAAKMILKKMKELGTSFQG